MAQLISGSTYAFRVDEIDLEDLVTGPYLSRSPENFTIDTGGGYVDGFTGHDFTYDHFGDPLSGTITGIHETLYGETTFEITGLDITVAELGDWAFHGTDRAAFAAMFSGNDSFIGSDFDDYMEGFDGHDNLFGGSGSDTLGGGSGNDHLYGRSLNGGSDGDDVLFGDAGSDYLQGNAGRDSLDGGTGSDRIVGGQGDDSILGDAGNDTVNGNLGNDAVHGEAGDDWLRGGQGDDLLNGGDDNDLLSGDLGVDILRGGEGADIFLFSGLGSTLGAGADRIADYLDGTDRLSVGYAPGAVLTGSPQSTLSAATAAQQLFDAHAGDGEVAALSVGGDTYIFYSSNGGATVDSAVLLEGILAGEVGLSDFV